MYKIPIILGEYYVKIIVYYSMYKIKLTNICKFCYVEIFVCNIVTLLHGLLTCGPIFII